MNRGRIVFTIVVTVCAVACIWGGAKAQPNYSHEDIAPGMACFFSHPPNTRFASMFGAVADFNNGDEVHCALVPVTGMAGLHKGGNAYIVQLSVDGAYCAEVEVQLPPVGPHQRMLAFPVFPDRRGNWLPQLASVFKACLESTSGRHRYTVTVFQRKDRLHLASGWFTADSYMSLRRLGAPPVGVAAVTAMQDTAVTAFLTSELSRNFPHLTLVAVESLSRWHDEPTIGGPILVCVVRYTVRDGDGKCYRGRSELRRVLSKNKLGRVLGEVWPNEACEN